MTSELERRRPTRTAKKAEFKPGSFVNYAFTDADKAQFKAWYSAKSFNGWEFIDQVLDSGYALSIKPDHYNDCIGAYLSTGDEKSPNYGLILSGKGRSSTMAVLAVLFRHFVLFSADWPSDAIRHSNLDDE